MTVDDNSKIISALWGALRLRGHALIVVASGEVIYFVSVARNLKCPVKSFDYVMFRKHTPAELFLGLDFLFFVDCRQSKNISLAGVSRYV